jgi:radical SAM protein with 4Fe4S-binding SPASM domain
MEINSYKLGHVDIEVNHRCNLACRHCSARVVKGNTTDELSAEEIHRLLLGAKPLGLKKVGLTGGEPLIDVPKTEKIARFCLDELGVPVHTHTNGTLVTKEMCRQGAILALFESVSVTFLGGDAETHERMTGIRGSYSESLFGARLIAEAGLPLTCYFIPTHGTCSGFVRLAERLKTVGATRIRAMALAPSGRARPIYGETAPVEEEWQKFERDLLEISVRLGLYIEAGNCTRLNMPGLSVLPGHDECMSGINRVHINSKGDVFPCTAASGINELRLGNLRKTGLSLDEIWLKSELVRQIRLVHEGHLPACEDCERSPKCQESCMVKVCGTMSDMERAHCTLVNGSAYRKYAEV